MDWVRAWRLVETRAESATLMFHLLFSVYGLDWLWVYCDGDRQEELKGAIPAVYSGRQNLDSETRCDRVG